jgi:hypothetical protein
MCWILKNFLKGGVVARKFLIALDRSEGAWRPVEYKADTFGDTPGVQVILLHVLSSLPPAFWDDGHILNQQEQESRQRLIGSWEAEQEKQWQGLVKKAYDRWRPRGYPRRR